MHGKDGTLEEQIADWQLRLQIGFGSNRKTRHMMPSGHKAFLVSNTNDVELLLMHNKTYAAEYVYDSSSRKRDSSPKQCRFEPARTEMGG